MMVVLFVVVVVIGLLVRRRAARKAMLSGLTAERPVFSVDPPTRRLSGRRWDAL